MFGANEILPLYIIFLPSLIVLGYANCKYVDLMFLAKINSTYILHTTNTNIKYLRLIDRLRNRFFVKVQ